MKKILLFASLFFAGIHFLPAQDYLTGKMTDNGSTPGTIYYDRTQYLVSSTIHQTQYKVVDADKKSLYTIFITHDQQKATITISTSVSGSDTKGTSIAYDNQKCGLIFSDAGNLDTVYPANKTYAYLLSFTDTTRDYPILHKLKTGDQKQIDLDPLTRLRVKKHNELVKKFYPAAQPARQVKDERVIQAKPADNLAKIEQITKESSVTYSLLNDTFNAQLFVLRDSLYARNNQYIEAITHMRNEVEYDISMLMKDAHVYTDEGRYGGEERNGIPQGKGLLVLNGNIYDGNFNSGNFITGKAVIKTKATVYYGESRRDSMSGKGWLKFTNGSFLLGEFVANKLKNGISLSKENGEVFFGSFVNNQRTGYGELRNNHGDSYYGEFLNGRLVKGYSKEVDQFGYSTYSRIESGRKATVPAQLAEAFFDTIHVIKEKAETQP